MAEVSNDELESRRNKIAIQVAKKRVSETFLAYYQIDKKYPNNHEEARKVEQILLRTSRDIDCVARELRKKLGLTKEAAETEKPLKETSEPQVAKKAKPNGQTPPGAKDKDHANKLRAICNLKDILNPPPRFVIPKMSKENGPPAPKPQNEPLKPQNEPTKPQNEPPKPQNEPPKPQNEPAKTSQQSVKSSSAFISQLIGQPSSQQKTAKRLVQKARLSISNRSSLTIRAANSVASLTKAKPTTSPEMPKSAYRKAVPAQRERPKETTAAEAEGTAPETTSGQETSASSLKTLSDEEVDLIFNRSSTVQAFATSLMMRMFTLTEMKRCKNVYGRTCGRPSKNKMPANDDALDPDRVAMIRRAVEKFAGKRQSIWTVCLTAMNQKIFGLKKTK